MTVKILDIKDIPAELWFEGKKIGVIETILQLYDIQCQIAVQEAEGYYILFTYNDNTTQINISKNGRLDDYPYGFFNTIERQLAFLCGWNKKYGNAD